MDLNPLVTKAIGAKNIMAIKEVVMLHSHPEYKALLKKNICFKNNYRSQKCFIIGNGPSIKKLDFSMLSDFITFTVNQSPRMPHFSDLNTNFHLWADERFFDIKKDNPEDMELLNIMKGVNSGRNKPVVFYKVQAKEMIETYGLDEELDLYYYADCYINKRERLKTFIDFSHLVPGFSTVIQYAICLAVYMGFKEIYLLGCDCTGFINIAQAKLKSADKAEYGYGISENEKQRMEKTLDSNSMRDELMYHAEMLDTYELLYQYCRRCGVALYNATEGGLLESIPRANIYEVLK